MTLYDDMQRIASGVLAQFDQGGIYYIAVVPGNGPADNPGEPVETAHKIDGAARGAKFKFVDGVNIVASDMQTTMAVSPNVVPDMNGFVTLVTIPKPTQEQILASPRYKLVRVDPVPPTGTPVVYRLFFRK